MLSEDSMFQFQTGAIKRQAKLRPAQNKPMCFNSKLVRLKVTRNIITHYDLTMFQFQTGAIKRSADAIIGRGDCTVSIPNWCD